jgi:hypothetical protein
MGGLVQMTGLIGPKAQNLARHPIPVESEMVKCALQKQI